MPTYQSTYMTQRKNLPQPADAIVSMLPFKIVMPAVLLANDILTIGRIPASIQIVDFDIVAPQLDSNGAPTLLHSIGIANAAQTDLATVFEAGLTFGRTAGGSISRATTSIPSLDPTALTAQRVIALKTTTAAATAALAGKTVLVILHVIS